MKNTFFAIVIIGLMLMVVYSLVRGIIAFLRSYKEDLGRDPSLGPSENQLLQNKMMMARIKWQALAIVVVGVALAMAH
jgi:hypothetical protein